MGRRADLDATDKSFAPAENRTKICQSSSPQPSHYSEPSWLMQ